MRNPFLVFLLLPALEIGLLAVFGRYYGLGAVAVEVLGSAVLGSLLLQRAGTRGLLQADARLREGGESPDAVLNELLRAVAGVLLIIPGLATDAVGLGLLLPPVRRRLARRWVAQGAVFRTGGGWHPGRAGEPPPRPRPGPARPAAPRRGDVIDGEFTREE